MMITRHSTSRLILSLLFACTLLVHHAPAAWAVAPLQQSPSSAAAAAATDQTPVRLVIPRISLDAAVEPVGQTATGEVAVPQEVGNVGWYNLGFMPGEQGNSVISGHLDSKAGRSEVFWRLRELKVGDRLSVIDQAGTERMFVVIERALYAYDKAPINQIFGYDLERDLNLITCAGRWNPRLHTYMQRLVVYTRLVVE